MTDESADFAKSQKAMSVLLVQLLLSWGSPTSSIVNLSFTADMNPSEAGARMRRVGLDGRSLI